MVEDVPVIVVGGSLVGLTASVLLGHHGVPHLLVERHAGTAIHPRAAAFHQRTMEIFRSAGMQEAVERAAEREFVQNGAIVSVDTLGGHELACFYRSVNEGVEGLSPTSRLYITQIGLLLTRINGAEWIEAANRIGGVGSYQFAAEDIAAGVGLTATGALLLRPDGVIGWRCKSVVPDPDAALAEALRRLIGHATS